MEAFKHEHPFLSISISASFCHRQIELAGLPTSTQIEPAVPKSIPTFTYDDYGKNTDPLFYIKQTRALIDKYK